MVVQNTQQRISQNATAKKKVLRMLNAALKAVDPKKAIKDNVHLRREMLSIDGKSWQLDNYDNIYVIGAGKATYGMAVAMEALLGDRITDGWINVPAVPRVGDTYMCPLQRIHAHRATHPFPSARNAQGAKKIVALAEKATKRDLVIALISGGGSAMLSLPAKGITLADKIATTKLLIKSPATIREINCVRKHLSRIKGGFLAHACSPAEIIALNISDVIGDDHGTIASGCMAPDESTFDDARRVLRKYKLWKAVPSRIRRHLSGGIAGNIRETPTAREKCFNTCSRFTFANHTTSAHAAADAAKKMGIRPIVLSTKKQGEARKVGRWLVRQAEKNTSSFRKKTPIALITSGETTVTVTGSGKGGRNQELVLAAMAHLKPGMTIASMGTDGVDGATPFPVAGAIADSTTLAHARKKNIDLALYLKNNDSYTALKELNAHIVTGPTGTNVGDIQLLLIMPS